MWGNLQNVEYVDDIVMSPPNSFKCQGTVGLLVRSQSPLSSNGHLEGDLELLVLELLPNPFFKKSHWRSLFGSAARQRAVSCWWCSVWFCGLTYGVNELCCSGHMSPLGREHVPVFFFFVSPRSSLMLACPAGSVPLWLETLQRSVCSAPRAAHSTVRVLESGNKWSLLLLWPSVSLCWDKEASLRRQFRLLSFLYFLKL